jgi:hypothetical protein
MKIRTAMTSLLATGALAAAPAAAQAAPTLQPGAYHETDAGSCTMNFVYTGGAQTYLGTAAHCVDKVGQTVQDSEGTTFGKVAFVGNADVTEEDYAFIEVDQEDLGRVSPAMKGHPQFPTGVTTPGETSTGDVVQASGFGVGFGETQPTQEQRRAALGYDDAEVHTLTGPVLFGDSGGPFAHVKTGKALGIVSRLCVGACSEEGPTVQGLLAKAAARGFVVTLKTV